MTTKTKEFEDVVKSDPPTELSTSDAPVREVEADKEPQCYVHLADGSVIRCKESDAPVYAGSNAPYGHWQRGNKIYQVVGVYPVEDNAPEGKE